jgi:hypothetical protein
MRQPSYVPTLSGNSGVVASAIPPACNAGSLAKASGDKRNYVRHVYRANAIIKNVIKS